MSSFYQQLSEKYKKIFFLTDDDTQLIKTAGQAIKFKNEAAFSELDAWITMQQDLQSQFTDAVIEAISQEEENTWLDFIDANTSPEYVERQINAAQKLQKLGLTFETNLAYLIALHDIIEQLYARHGFGSFELIRAFKKIAGISICIVIDTYNQLINETIKAQNTALMEMSTPVTKLWDGILFLPLVGIIDSRRAQEVMTAMLKKISETESQVFILDISGIAVLDTAVANYLIRIAKAAALMGCRCIVSGISGAVAQTIVELGIHTDEMTTTGNMQDALEKAFKRAKLTISSKKKK
jgi:rsbT co-antagonist protein RsbR